MPHRLSIGHYRLDMSGMSGRSVLDEAIAGSGKLGKLHHELGALQHTLADPARAGEMEAVLERFGGYPYPGATRQSGSNSEG